MDFEIREGRRPQGPRKLVREPETYFRLVDQGMGYSEAAHAVGINGMGFALGMGVLLDAFVVRMTLVPAVMAVLGARAWWLPRFPQRALPDVDIEGERPARRLAPTGPEQRTAPARVAVHSEGTASQAAKTY